LKDAEKCRDQALVKWEVVVIDDDDQDELEWRSELKNVPVGSSRHSSSSIHIWYMN
jgi:glycosyltransferase involved in cell wall biosynthesis